MDFWENEYVPKPQQVKTALGREWPSSFVGPPRFQDVSRPRAAERLAQGEPHRALEAVGEASICLVCL